MAHFQPSVAPPHFGQSEVVVCAMSPFHVGGGCSGGVRRRSIPTHPTPRAPGQHPAQGPERAHREDRRREVISPVPERSKLFAVVGERHEQTQDGGHRRTHHAQSWPRRTP